MIYAGFVLCFLLGGAAGFAVGVWYLKKQLQKMQMDEKQVLAVARSMGLNLNAKQLQTVMRHMKQASAKSVGKTKSKGNDRNRRAK